MNGKALLVGGRPSFGRSLTWRISGLLLLALVVFFVFSYRFIVRPAVAELALAQMTLVSQQTDARVRRLLESVETTIRSSHGWGIHGNLSHDELLRFNEFFFPIIEHHREIASVIFADENGREILLLRGEKGRWINRLSDPDRWGGRAFWITWDAAGRLEQVESREIDYDARRRPWFVGVSQRRHGDIYWTEPYTFYSTRQTGITAAMSWMGADGRRFVIGHDVNLSDVARFSGGDGLGSDGRVAVIDRSGTLIASAGRAEPEARWGGGTDPLAAEGVQVWRAAGARAGGLSSFQYQGSDWVGLFRDVEFGGKPVWLAVFAPREVFNPVRSGDFVVLGLIALAVMGLGHLVAQSVARQFARPLEALARESERIGRMDLAAPVAVESAWLEVDELARAEEDMRRRLLEATGELSRAKAVLEVKVEERTDALARQVTLVQALLDTVPYPVFYLGPDARFTGCNRTYEEAFGIDPARLTGRRVADLRIMDAGDLATYQADNEKVIAEGSQIQREVILPFADGKLHHTLITVHGFRDPDGSPGGLVGLIADVTPLKEVQRRLEENERRFRFFATHVDEGIMVIEDGKVADVSEVWAEMFRCRREDAVGSSPLDYTAPEMHDEVRRRITAGEGGRYESVLKRADGSTFPALVRGRTVDYGGRPVRLTTVLDISRQKETEAALIRARAEAERAAAAKAEFLANMSHEIRTPMNAVIGMTQLALQTRLDDRQRRYLERVDAAGRGLVALINDILDFSKLEAGRMRIEYVPFRLDELAGHVVDLTALKAAEKDIELLVDIDPRLPLELVGDPTRLGQVLTNLLGNAVKFTERGEVLIRVALAGPGGAEGRVRARFEVRDSGIGMDADTLSRIFSAFVQADSSTTRRFGGTGLGLSIVDRLVTLMGGKIEVDSAPGEGSRFHFSLEFGVGATREERRRVAFEPSQLRVLVADDNLSAGEIFRNLLEGIGCRVTVTAGGGEALTEIAQARQAGDPYQLFLCDWKMPGLDGIETIRRLRVGEGQGMPACILATAYDRDSLAEALDGVPVAGVLSKPVSASTLFDAIATALGHAPRHSGENRRGAPPPPPDLVGRRILLAEDNPVNRELAEELLRRCGAAVESAADGTEALDWLARAEFDLVLMDCQMPGIDGYEATRRLRAEGRRLPVIAMTASAQAGVREDCVAAGMNDYLAKPLDLTTFHAVLGRWLPASAASAAVPPSQTSGIEGHEPEIVPGAMAGTVADAIDWDDALARAAGDESLLRRLLASFRDREADLVQRARALLASGDLVELGRQAHTLKGAAANLGAKSLAAVARSLEGAVATGADACAETLPALAATLESTFAAIDAALRERHAQARFEAAPAVTLESDQLAFALRELERALAADDARAAALARDLAARLVASPHATRVAALAAQAAQFRYDAALAALHDFAESIGVPIEYSRGDNDAGPAPETDDPGR